MKMKYPNIYLVLDNCFAIKRWVKPSEWLQLTKEIGFNYAQASTDNEIDPLFSPEQYMDDWFAELKRNEKKTGVKVINFYTGYQTYRTIGLAHHDERVREKLLEGWFKPLIRRIADLNAAGIGFSYFAIPDEALQDPAKYRERTELILSQLQELAEFADENGKVAVSFEQMYAPQQPPWTIDGTKHYLKRIYEARQKPLFVTLDVGHMVGQCKFLRPTKATVVQSLSRNYRQGELPPLWLGSDSTYQKWSVARQNCHGPQAIDVAAEAICAEMAGYPYLFAEKRDGDIFEWLGELACYSPIIHMQQTNGIVSSHAAFTAENNKNGVVTGEKLLSAIARSYQRQTQQMILPPTPNIYLSFEIFASNTEKKVEIIDKLKQTLEYWRQYVPEDGLPLDKLI
jgi:sugar phosphate isomerase/epimerase